MVAAAGGSCLSAVVAVVAAVAVVAVVDVVDVADVAAVVEVAVVEVGCRRLLDTVNRLTVSYCLIFARCCL